MANNREVAAQSAWDSFDVTLVGLLFSLLILLQPQLAFGARSEFFKTSNTQLQEIVEKGPVYIDFWASWCEACKESLPWLSKMKADGINVVTVNLDTEPKNAELLLKELKIGNLPVISDPNGIVPSELDLATMPESILIGAKAKIVSVHSGFHSSEKAEREREIRAVVLNK